MVRNCINGILAGLDLFAVCDHNRGMLTESAKTPETNTVAHDRVYRLLRAKIMHGEIKPGEALTLRGIGKMFDVSMTPAREGVRRLVAEGGLLLSASGRVTTASLSNERLEELAAIRALLEPEMASRALPRAHMALISRLEAINAVIAEKAAKHDAIGYIQANLDFHRTLYRRAQAPAMLAMTETVWLQIGPTMRALYSRLNRTELPYDHRLIVAALKAGDEPSLRLAIRSDVTQGLRLLMV